MQALILDHIGGIEVRKVPDPVVREGEVLVEVKSCGICGSDIPRVYETGAHRMPLIIGHEFCGVAGGRRVGVFPLIPCRKCDMCRAGNYELCRNYDYLGSRRDGGMAELAAVPADNLIELPDNVSFEQAAMLEPMAVAVHATKRAFAALGRRAKRAAVLGTGPIGRLVAMFLSDAGVETVDIIDTRKDDPGEGSFDLVFECVGRREVYEAALSLAAPLSVVMLVGNPASDMTAKRDNYWKILRNELTVLGTWNSSFREDWEYALSRVASGAVAPESLITHRLPLSDIEQGFIMMRDKSEKYCKVMCEL